MMAQKTYTQTIQRALDDQIAALLATEAVATKERTPAPAGSMPAPSAPQPAPPPVADGALAADEEATGGFGAWAPAPAAPRRGVASLPSPAATVANLDQRISRLMQVRDWIQEDGDIAQLLDAVIGQQVQSSARRQMRLSIALNIIFLVAGWALSLVTPNLISKL